MDEPATFDAQLTASVAISEAVDSSPDKPVSDNALPPVVSDLDDWDTKSKLENEKLRDRELLIASREFAEEQRSKSWFHLLTTLLAIGSFAAIAAFAPIMLVRILGSVLTGLTVVRLFILYHDYQHNAIFKHSKLGGGILPAYGFFMLTPPSVWKRSHDHHHRNNSKLFGASIGSFPIMTTENYMKASSSEQREYRIARSPMIILLGYFSVFLFGMCVRPFLVDQRRHWDALVSLIIHYTLIGTCFFFAGWLTTFLVLILPALIATCCGSYLFYAQHNFPTAKIRPRDQWTYTGAALQSSSFLKMNPVMHWFTGNIGYHHVHHLNDKIPFYRLPETMQALKPLQSPNETTLWPGEILKCLKLKLWDPTQNRFVSYAEATESFAREF